MSEPLVGMHGLSLQVFVPLSVLGVVMFKLCV